MTTASIPKSHLGQTFVLYVLQGKALLLLSKQRSGPKQRPAFANVPEPLYEMRRKQAEAMACAQY